MFNHSWLSETPTRGKQSSAAAIADAAEDEHGLNLRVEGADRPVNTGILMAYRLRD